MFSSYYAVLIKCEEITQLNSITEYIRNCYLNIFYIPFVYLTLLSSLVKSLKVSGLGSWNWTNCSVLYAWQIFFYGIVVPTVSIWKRQTHPLMSGETAHFLLPLLLFTHSFIAIHSLLGEREGESVCKTPSFCLSASWSALAHVWGGWGWLGVASWVSSSRICNEVSCCCKSPCHSARSVESVCLLDSLCESGRVSHG